MHNIPITETGILPQIVIDYLNQDKKINTFYSYTNTIENYKKLIDEKDFSVEKRKILVDVILSQYQNANIDLTNSSLVKSTIHSLSNSNTFSITTGHQLCIFGGPLYFIYKICTAIDLAKQLAEKYPQYNFAPVFWLASEDHDFDEINSIHLFGKKIKWEKVTNHQAVGGLDLEAISTQIDLIAELIGEKGKSKKWIEILRDSYSEKYNLSQGTTRFVHEIFKNEGLIILDANDASLKKQLLSVIKKDLFEQQSFHAVNQTNKELKKNYKLQINGREINFFYLHEKYGRRLIKKRDNGFELADSDVIFSKDQLGTELELYPEKFSPNVLLRPIYQELILPNLAYVGGPAEVAYWLQLKAVFDNYKIQYPIIVLRNSFLILGKSMNEKIKKYGLEIKDFFKDEKLLTDLFISKKSETNLPIYIDKVDELFQNIFDETKNTDSKVAKEILKTKKEINSFLISKLNEVKQSAKLKNESEIVSLLKLKEKIFPLGIFQERIENIIQYDYQMNENLVHIILSNSDAFNTDLKILMD